MLDAHAHLPLDTSDTQQLLDRRDLRLMNICVDTAELGGLDAQRRWYRDLHRARPDRFSWCTSFSLAGFGGREWLQTVLRQLDDDFDNGGAVACKVWKNIGMDLRDPDTGRYVLVDDERFSPIFEHLAKRKIPLLMHIGEPLACWQALDPRSPHFGYYSNNPQWHWHGRNDVPSHAELMAARDRVAERFPDLTVIGAHYGSHEYDFAEVARRFERYPNFFVDTSARLGDAAERARRDHAGVRAFFIKYAKRILWGVDWVLTRPTSTMTDEQRRKLVKDLDDRYDLEWRFFTTGEELLIGGHLVRGLALPADVVPQLFETTASELYAP